MRSSIPLLALCALLANPAARGATPVIEPLGLSSYKIDWVGEGETTYFIQWSLDLQSWQYFPVIDHGVEHDEFNFSSSSDRFFVRLVPFYNPDSDPLYGDFDDDGLSNIFEVTYGYDPLNTDSTEVGPDASLDPEQDGLSNISEEAAGTNPTLKDHPAVGLGVTVGN